MFTSGDFAEQLALSKFRLLLSLHSSRKGKQYTKWVLLRNRSAVRASSTKERSQTKTLSAVRFNEGKNCTLWNAYPNTLHCNGQGERKENEGGAVSWNIPGKPFGFYIRMNSERTRCELLILGKNFLVSVWGSRGKETIGSFRYSYSREYEDIRKDERNI